MLPDYREYHFNVRERMGCILLAGGAAALLAYLFYRSLYAVPLLALLTIPVYRMEQDRKMRVQRQNLEQQFKDAMQAMTSALQAGYSVENAIRETCGDMAHMYGKDGLITQEFSYMVQGVRNNHTPEELMEDLALRSGSEDLMEFGGLFGIAKRTGGNLTEILKSCGSTICDKLDTKKEIATVMAAKRLEGRIMDMIPCAIILYIDLSSPGFFRCLYHNILGVIIMTVCLAAYLGAVLLSEKIMSVEV
ncbi:MAG: type II secretion system F family protein [bacterium]|nr:type II secretion system F family protein [bacterium]